jgi:hypothetical protein
MVDALSAQQIKERYPDPVFRAKLFDLAQTNILLSECIIDNAYKIPASLYQPIVLSEYGNDIYKQLRRKNVGHPEAMLLCLLELFHMDLLVDVEQTDREAIVAAISAQIGDAAILFPFIHGRMLYDKYANQFLDREPSFLTLAETKQLLRGTPQGVFQTLDLVTGPYGILRSQSERFVMPTKEVHLKHCSDLTCARVHIVSLSTGSEARINKDRKTIDDIFDREGEHGSEWAPLFQEISAERLPLYRDTAFDPIIFLIGDALVDDELRMLLQRLCESRGDHTAETVSGLGLHGSLTVITKQLQRAQLMQLILTAKDNDIVSSIDTLTQRGHINVPSGEVRRPVVNRETAFGRYGLKAELGEYGVRIQSALSTVAPLRARRLVNQMYDINDIRDQQELEWQLRKEPGESLAAKLEHYLQTQPPIEALRKLVLVHRSNVIIATEHLNLIDGTDDEDSTLLSTIAWKLGFSVVVQNEKHARFWNLHERMLQQTRQSPLGRSEIELEEIRGVAANYFTELETVLDDSLAFVTWALTNDHYASGKPFIYRPAIDRLKSFERLTSLGKKQRPITLTFGDRNTLFPLMRGFEMLALLLKNYAGDHEDLLRPKNQFPTWTTVQDLQQFPFLHTVPFLDLLVDCGASIIQFLTDISGALVSSGISDARNEWLHGRRTAADLDRLRLGLEKVGEAVHLIEESGFSRQRYSWVRNESDGQGRQTAVLANGSGRELALFRPSPFEWLRLPGLSSSWYVLHSARFAEPSEVLRFGIELDSAYAKMWSDYPKRPKAHRLGDATSSLGVSDAIS